MSATNNLKTIWIINQYASTPETGMGGRHYYLARGLEKLGHKVYIVAASYTHLLRQPPDVNGFYTLERREGVNILWVKMPEYDHAHSKKRILNWFIFGLKILGVRKSLPDSPDVILYSSPSLVGYLGAERLARRLHATLVFEVRDIWPLTLCELGGYAPSHPFIRFLQWIEDRAYRNADLVVSNLKSAWQHMVEHGLKRAKFHWIPNGIWLDEVTSPEPLREAVQGKLPQDAFVVGYTGTLGLANSMDTLVEAAALLKDYPNIKFVLVGEGRERPAIEALIQKLGVESVIFTGAIPKAQVQIVLQQCNALFLAVKMSSLYRFGVALNKLYDYLYAGKPLLYAIDSGDYHPVTEANCGIEVAPENPKALADAILKLYHLPADERNRMGQSGRQLALAQYEYGSLAEKLVSIF